MTSWDSSVSFHINYSELSRISRSPSAQQHTHTCRTSRVDTKKAHSEPVSLFEIQHSQGPISLVSSASWIHYHHTNTPIVVFIILTSTTSLPTFFFLPREPQYGCWWPSLVSLFLSPPRFTCSVCFPSLSHCADEHAHSLFSVLLLSSLSHSFKHLVSFLPFARSFFQPSLLSPFYLSLFSHYSLSLIH